ncbi:MAG TPA: hypothetical protein VHM90_10570 [Phycisphaerae bacterium]|jgi:hypothetical protein|nr:hypothetical protein [Phycisphaerae bacterium]
MPFVFDTVPLTPPAHLSDESTIAEYLKWAQSLLPQGRVLVRIELNGALLEGAALAHVRRDPLGTATLTLSTGEVKEISLTTLGKLAALIEWLAPQHRSVAEELERGQTQHGLERLQGILSAWQQIQQAYGNLAKMLEISLGDLPVHDLNGEAVLDEFCKQLGEIQTALSNQDFVMLADILQYEMDGAIANWMALLEATLGVVEPVAA